MRILFLGAGGTGGYFGGRAAQAGADVSFLVRQARAARLREDGLVIKSGAGDARIEPTLVTAETLEASYDAVVLSCKAYDLQSALTAIAPAVGPDTVILPIMNGVGHYEELDRRFGAHRVLGGLCQIVATMNAAGHVVHTGNAASLIFGERSADKQSARAVALRDAFAASDKYTTLLSDDIYQDIWEKFVFLSTLAGATCLFRGTVGHIMRTDDGEAILRAMLAEAQSVAAAESHPVRARADAQALARLTDPESSLTASMYRDLQAGGEVEAQPIVGDMVRRAKLLELDIPFFRAAYTHLQVYQQTRKATS